LALAPSLLSQAATTLLEPLLANVVGKLGIDSLHCGIGSSRGGPALAGLQAN